jgi:hypothetical protein
MVGDVDDTRANLPSVPLLRLNVHEDAHQIVRTMQVLSGVVVINQLIQVVRLMKQVVLMTQVLPLMREMSYYPSPFHIKLM